MSLYRTIARMVSLLRFACYGINCPEISKIGSLCRISRARRATSYKSPGTSRQLPPITLSYEQIYTCLRNYYDLVPSQNYIDANESLRRSTTSLYFSSTDSRIVCKPGVIAQLFITIFLIYRLALYSCICQSCIELCHKILEN